jgi:hypothetical protein
MATIYDGNSNCLECGRLVAPSSGLYGPGDRNHFCCRKCLRMFYDSQPGLWEDEEQLHLEHLEYEREQEEITQAWRQQKREEEEKSQLEEQERQRQKHLEDIQRRNSHIGLFVVFLILTYLIGNVWIWLAFIIYTLFLFNKWCDS